MSQNVDGAFKMFTAGAALAQYLRVILSSGKLAAAGVGATDYVNELGVIEEASFADLDVRAVRLRTAQGTVRMVASAAISLGATVYGAASGKIATTSSGTALGIALEAAAANNDVIEVLRIQ